MNPQYEPETSVLQHEAIPNPNFSFKTQTLDTNDVILIVIWFFSGLYRGYSRGLMEKWKPVYYRVNLLHIYIYMSKFFQKLHFNRPPMPHKV